VAALVFLPLLAWLTVEFHRYAHLRAKAFMWMVSPAVMWLLWFVDHVVLFSAVYLWYRDAALHAEYDTVLVLVHVDVLLRFALPMLFETDADARTPGDPDEVRTALVVTAVALLVSGGFALACMAMAYAAALATSATLLLVHAVFVLAMAVATVVLRVRYH
jgi:hypothetical protein